MIDISVPEDIVNNPSHYKCHQHECIDEMVAIFGVEQTIAFCRLNAWKYRYRADSKGTHDIDMQKSDWYVNKAMELQGMVSKDDNCVTKKEHSNSIRYSDNNG